MHELAITQSLLKIALDKADEAGAGRIRTITLMIGRLSGYVPEAVQANFEILSPGTPAEGAELRIEWMPVSCRCRDCGREYQAEVDDLRCPGCRTPRFEVTGGREMYIESMEVEG
ncbi:MAG TPA: hydrogenase maturation nickel metallochaperone HypA [candidate division Zixibacteria bacterium]|nr:hydrogenase maturation nickel metallochaperone HypA [candidate division Zixibacteria bacterium]